jgi:hypothetical protein
MDVHTLNVSGRQAILTDGRVVPITNLFDACGEETDDLDEAVSFVCGEGDEWFSDLLSSFETAAIH